MDKRRFDNLTRTLAGGIGSRRTALRLLSGGTLGAFLGRLLPDAAASAQATCKPPGRRCKTNEQCCSEAGPPPGICKKKGDTKKCRCDDGRLPCAGVCCPTAQSCKNTICQYTCTSSNLSNCPEPSNPCQQKACNNGVCGESNIANDTPCDDGDPCTENDVCTAGACSGTAKVCPTSGNEPQICCAAGSTTCTPGGCCRDSGVKCSQDDQCCSGSCPGTGPRTCA